MVQMLDKRGTLTAEVDDSGPLRELELPTNRLNSANLQASGTTIGNATATLSEAWEPSVDWVEALSKAHPVTELIIDDVPQAPPAPSGMGDHITAPARMIPARRSLVPESVKRMLISLLALVAIASGVGVGTYALLDSGLLGVLFGPPPTVTGPQVQNQDQSDTRLPPVEEPAPVIKPATASPEQLRDSGIVEYRLGQYEAAIRLLEDAVNTGTNDARTYYQLGLAYLATPTREHALDDAELAFRTAVSLQPEWAAAHQMLAESLVRQGYYAEAVQPALEATRIDPTSGEAWLTLSRAYKGTGQETDATRAYAEASRLAPAPPLQP